MLTHAQTFFRGVEYMSLEYSILARAYSAEEVGQAISELSRELSTNEIALFSIVFSAEFGQKNLYWRRKINREKTSFLQNFKCSSTPAKDLVISAKISKVNVIFNVIFMFEVSRLPATC
jgi:hypothetical protein